MIGGEKRDVWLQPIIATYKKSKKTHPLKDINIIGGEKSDILWLHTCNLIHQTINLMKTH